MALIMIHERLANAKDILGLVKEWSLDSPWTCKGHHPNKQSDKMDFDEFSVYLAVNGNPDGFL